MGRLVPEWVTLCNIWTITAVGCRRDTRLRAPECEFFSASNLKEEKTAAEQAEDFGIFTESNISRISSPGFSRRTYQQQARTI
ncbi:MAG: hypothetical protein H6618_09340 [Deltaproteobacteria bacterium]|nr:hypothetical protein [Deltaproteobacteria bacterium]